MTEIIAAAVAGVLVIMNSLVLTSQRKSDKARADAEERMALLLECTEACLDGVQQLGANGRVTQGLKRLEHYKNKKSAQ